MGGSGRMCVRAVLMAAILAISAVFEAQAATAASVRGSFSSAVKVATPSVVNIYTSKVAEGSAMEKDPRMGRLVGPARDRVRQGLGSGVIVRDGGFVVTNLHVIQGASSVKVGLSDGREYNARVAGSDEKLDIAVLKLDVPGGTRLPVAKIGDSDSLEVGDVVLALGNPYGIGQSASMGIVSAVARSNASLSAYGQFIQTDASINPGDSGGALIDSTGALVGINTAIYTKTGGNVGIGFAIPSNLVKTVVNDIASVGRVVRPWLGAEGQAMTEGVARELGLRDRNGVLLTAVVPNSPAALAGLKPGDVIIRLAGKDVTDPASLNDRIMATPNLLNRPTSIVIWREGKMSEVQATLTALPPRDVEGRVTVTGYNPLNGVVVEALTPSLNADLSLALSTRGVAVVNVPVKAPLAGFNMEVQPGDLLLAINGSTIRSPRDVQKAVDSDRRKWDLRLQRDGRVIKLLLQ